MIRIHSNSSWRVDQVPVLSAESYAWAGAAAPSHFETGEGCRTDCPRSQVHLELESTELVGERGFEPPTPWSRTRCSTRLSHSPIPREKAPPLGACLVLWPRDALPQVYQNCAPAASRSGG